MSCRVRAVRTSTSKRHRAARMPSITRRTPALLPADGTSLWNARKESTQPSTCMACCRRGSSLLQTGAVVGSGSCTEPCPVEQGEGSHAVRPGINGRHGEPVLSCYQTAEPLSALNEGKVDTRAVLFVVRIQTARGNHRRRYSAVSMRLRSSTASRGRDRRPGGVACTLVRTAEVAMKSSPIGRHLLDPAAQVLLRRLNNRRGTPYRIFRVASALTVAWRPSSSISLTPSRPCR